MSTNYMQLLNCSMYRKPQPDDSQLFNHIDSHIAELFRRNGHTDQASTNEIDCDNAIAALVRYFDGFGVTLSQKSVSIAKKRVNTWKRGRAVERFSLSEGSLLTETYPSVSLFESSLGVRLSSKFVLIL